ncbi:unnamed protein product [Phaedon cochleariae]|uniref:Exonuclease 1 n=1 Tax=Phaedon cochleariae TaxID=80249 RepID=A0A9N9X3Y4_PHACE|nr:unnamed protein product [Phaedon cochleariae]
MGITGLLPFLEKATKPCHLAEFRGATVVVDTYCWLHKGATGCYFQLAQGDDSHVYVDYCMKYVKLLQSHAIRPILVFDGKNLPAKADTETKRRESRTKAKQRAAELLRLGKTEEARSYMKQSINITPEMASAVIKECQKMNIDCIVAPYESDAQLAFFNLKGIADIVITEDSDLMTFGCTKVLYKLDMRGCGFLVEAEKIPLAMNIRPDKYTFDKFRYMCILSGCDYVASLPGIGLKKALKFIMLTEETNPEIFLDRVPRYLNMRHLEVTKEYKENFLLADATFRHQTVFDPAQKKLVPLTDPEVSGTNPKYCKNAGEIYNHEIAYQVALGNLHPSSHKQINNWVPPENVLCKNSIWSGSHKKSDWNKHKKLVFKKKCVKTETEVKIENVNYEQIKIEEEKRLEQELQCYFTVSEKHTSKKGEEETPTKYAPKENATITSPILNRNPFLKRLSKFPCHSSTERNVIIKSRYFVNSTDVPVKDEQADTTVSGAKTEEHDPEIPNNIIDDETEELRKITISDITLLEQNSEISRDAKVMSNSQPNPSKSTIETSIQKRKRLGPCRSVGLKRTKSEGQKTLHSFFRKM